MKITGKLLEVKDTQQISDTFKKREFIVEYAENPNYPEYLAFELIQDRCTLIDAVKVGQEIEVNFNLRGRKWVNPEGVTKYFISLQAWRIEAMNHEVDNAVANDVRAKDNERSPQDDAINASEEDDLPF